MKKNFDWILIATLCILQVNCRSGYKLGNVYNISGDLYFGYQKGLVSAFQYFVFTKSDTVYIQHFWKISGALQMPFSDTLRKQGENLYVGNHTELVKEKTWVIILRGSQRKVILNVADAHQTERWEKNNEIINGNSNMR